MDEKFLLILNHLQQSPNLRLMFGSLLGAGNRTRLFKTVAHATRTQGPSKESLCTLHLISLRSLQTAATDLLCTAR
jgi:hypothetical protein